LAGGRPHAEIGVWRDGIPRGASTARVPHGAPSSEQPSPAHVTILVDHCTNRGGVYPGQRALVEAALVFCPETMAKATRPFGTATAPATPAPSEFALRPRPRRPPRPWRAALPSSLCHRRSSFSAWTGCAPGETRMSPLVILKYVSHKQFSEKFLRCCDSQKSWDQL